MKKEYIKKAIAESKRGVAVVYGYSSQYREKVALEITAEKLNDPRYVWFIRSAYAIFDEVVKTYPDGTVKYFYDPPRGIAL